MPKQPSFAERIQLLQDALALFDKAANVVEAEIDRMIAAEKRFADRRGQKRERRPAN